MKTGIKWKEIYAIEAKERNIRTMTDKELTNAILNHWKSMDLDRIADREPDHNTNIILITERNKRMDGLKS